MRNENGGSGVKKDGSAAGFREKGLGIRKGDWRFPRAVISSEVEGSPLQNGISSYKPLWKR